MLYHIILKSPTTTNILILFPFFKMKIQKKGLCVSDDNRDQFPSLSYSRSIELSNLEYLQTYIGCRRCMNNVSEGTWACDAIRSATITLKCLDLIFSKC